jgi:hypothetical protein
MLTFHFDAQRAFSPSMRQKIDVQAIWLQAVRLFAADAEQSSPVAGMLGWATMPLSLDALVGDDFEVDTRLAALGPPA